MFITWGNKVKLVTLLKNTIASPVWLSQRLCVSTLLRKDCALAHWYLQIIRFRYFLEDSTQVMPSILCDLGRIFRVICLYGRINGILRYSLPKAPPYLREARFTSSPVLVLNIIWDAICGKNILKSLEQNRWNSVPLSTYKRSDACLTQLVEYRFCKPTVNGSSPLAGLFFFFWQ